ncbi:MAG: hypothetical protein JSU68_03625, partial [Phycisphaerales bacterium]
MPDEPPAPAGAALMDGPGRPGLSVEDVLGASATLRHDREGPSPGRDRAVDSTHIRARRGWAAIDLPELWRHRELL